MESSSQDYNFVLLNTGRHIRWIFPDIDLVDSLTNDIGSIGFITYRLSLLNRTEGTEITNQANIYFDFNEPIPTNTTLTTLTDPIVDAVSLEGETADGCVNRFYVSDQQLIVDFSEPVDSTAEGVNSHNTVVIRIGSSKNR